MRWYSKAPGFEVSHVVDNYPWSDISGTVVDIGGSHGNVCVGIAEKFPSLHFIVQDQPSVVEFGRSKLPAHLEDRVTFMEHDFFTEQPVKGASVYLFRYIIHDWSDPYAICILKALIPALRNGSKILINEHILPEPGVMTTYQEKHLRLVTTSSVRVLKDF